MRSPVAIVFRVTGVLLICFGICCGVCVLPGHETWVRPHILGTVSTLDGVPLPLEGVIFRAKKRSDSPSEVATTNAEGRFDIPAFKRREMPFPGDLVYTTELEVFREGYKPITIVAVLDGYKLSVRMSETEILLNFQLAKVDSPASSTCLAKHTLWDIRNGIKSVRLVRYEQLSENGWTYLEQPPISETN